MSNFQRRLPEGGMAALERLVSNRGGWWPDLLGKWAPSGSPDGLRLAIRNRYMNFYSKGQSIAKISFGSGGRLPTMRIHEKYVKRCSTGGQRYVKLRDDTVLHPDGRRVDWSGSKMLRTWVDNSRKYSGREKRCIDELVGVSPKVIDLEMGLPAFDDRKTALRIDIVALDGTPEDIRLVFWEAKMIGDKRLRSKQQTPEVFKQIDLYRRYLEDSNRRQQVTEAYRECCRIVCQLHAMAACVDMLPPPAPDRLIEAACDPSVRFRIDDLPIKLVIFDEREKRDMNKRAVDAWRKHLEVLRREVPVAIVEQRPITDPLETLPILAS